MLTNHGLLPAQVLRSLPNPSLLEAIVFSRANRVTEICTLPGGECNKLELQETSLQDGSCYGSMWAPCDVKAIINCSPGRVWGWELIWIGVNLQIGACAGPNTKREQAIFFLEWETFPAEFVCHLK